MSAIDLSKYLFEPNHDLPSYQFWISQLANYWTHHHFKFINDKKHFEDDKVPRGLKNAIMSLVGFFVIGDGLIAEDLVPLMLKAIQEKNWPKFYAIVAQLNMENIHAAFYTKAMTIFPPEEKAAILEKCLKKPCVIAKANWLHGATDVQTSEGLNNVAMAAGEGIFFISLFSTIFYIRKYGYFPDFIEGNEKISGDESQHRDNKCMEARRSLKEDEKDRALEIIKDAVRVECLTIDELFLEPIVPGQDEDSGFTKENVTQYIHHLADDILVKCGLPKHYNVDMDKYTFSWMEDINMSQKGNFYERDVINSYRESDPVTAMKEAKGEFEDEEDAFNDPMAVDL